MPANDGYTVKAVVTEKNGNQYYDHKLSKIEKGRLIDILTALSSTEEKSLPSMRDEFFSQLDDKRLIQILQQEEVSKVVDSNGEPLVVYHGSRKKDIDEFIAGENAYYGSGTYFQGRDGAIAWIGLSEEEMERDRAFYREMYKDDPEFAEKAIRLMVGDTYDYIYPSFLSIKNPTVAGSATDATAKLIKMQVESYESSERLRKETNQHIRKIIFGNVMEQASKRFIEETGYDGVVIPYKGWYLAIQRNQIKSIYNNGQFSEDDNRTRHKREVERVSFDKDAAEGRVLNYREVTMYIGESVWTGFTLWSQRI